MNQAEFIFFFAQTWGILGALVAIPFLVIGIDRIDEDARGAYAFRPLLVPGVILLWPLVLWRWWVLETNRDSWVKRHAPPRRIHFAAAMVLAVAIPVIIALGWVNRPVWPSDFVPQKLPVESENTQ